MESNNYAEAAAMLVTLVSVMVVDTGMHFTDPQNRPLYLALLGITSVCLGCLAKACSNKLTA